MLGVNIDCTKSFNRVATPACGRGYCSLYDFGVSHIEEEAANEEDKMPGSRSKLSAIAVAYYS